MFSTISDIICSVTCKYAMAGGGFEVYLIPKMKKESQIPNYLTLPWDLLDSFGWFYLVLPAVI